MIMPAPCVSVALELACVPDRPPCSVEWLTVTMEDDTVNSAPMGALLSHRIVLAIVPEESLKRIPPPLLMARFP